jgi:hypothetical protein
LNPNQAKKGVSPVFQNSVAQLLLQISPRFPNFSSAFAMEIADAVGKGNPLGITWLNFLCERELVPLRSVALILKWADPRKIPIILHPTLQAALAEVEDGTWPPVSIGNLPIETECLTLNPDEFEIVEPGDTAPEDFPPQPAVVDDTRDFPTHSPSGPPVLEIW